MPKIEKRTVDDRLPKWLHSKFLSAVDYIWQGKNESMEERNEREGTNIAVDISGIIVVLSQITERTNNERQTTIRYRHLFYN